MAWQKGPMPKDTYNWGGVVSFDHVGMGFSFADFKGDHVIMNPDGGKGVERRLEPHEVAWFDNCLVLPPSAKSRTGE